MDRCLELKDVFSIFSISFTVIRILENVIIETVKKDNNQNYVIDEFGINNHDTVCPRSFDLFYIVISYIKLVKISWAYSR